MVHRITITKETVGLEEFADPKGIKIYPKLVGSGKTMLPDKSSLDADVQIFEEIANLLGTTIGPSKRTIPKFFDRILGHLAKQFSTCVENALTVNFFAKLKRVCKYQIASCKVKDFSSYDLLKAICNDNVEKPTPEILQEFVDNVRGSLGIPKESDLPIFEDSTFSFPSRFAVHWFLQQKLAEFGERKLMLSPVFKVHRIHIRLDSTHLALLRNDLEIAPIREAVEKLRPSDELPKCPNAESHPNKKDRKIAKDEWKIERDAYNVALEKWREARKDCMAKNFLNTLDRPEDPEKKLGIEIPVPSIKIPEGTNKNSPEGKCLRAKLRLQCDEAKKKRRELRSTPEYQTALQKYQEYEQTVQEYGLGMFVNFQDRNPKLGWKPSASVMTDTVSLCVNYERSVPKVEKTCDQMSEEMTEKNKEKRLKSKEARELKPCDDYDPDANTCFMDRLILGLDPGRVSLATIICIEPNGDKTTWRLSRGQYHTESGILRENKKQQKRMKPLIESFATLTQDGGALRASSTEEIRKYVQAYKKFEESWFSDFAFKQEESWSHMKRYSGKQKTLATFFSKVRKDAEKIAIKHGLKRLEVAYGACGPKMASCGRGELAVPTTGTYRACVTAFMKQLGKFKNNIVSLEDEGFTSKVSWETGKNWEKVYKTHKANGKEYLQHTANKYSPIVNTVDLEQVQKRRLAMKAKSVKWRGGGTNSCTFGEAGVKEPTAPKIYEKNDTRDARKVRHIDVRGLLFCPERRMYFDRDEQSARAIAGLRCIKLAGLGRPTAFRKQKKAQETAANNGWWAVSLEDTRDAAAQTNYTQSFDLESVLANILRPCGVP